MNVYVVEMLHAGDESCRPHQYLLGVYSSSAAAEEAVTGEMAWRGGKYEPRVTEFVVDAPMDEDKLDSIGDAPRHSRVSAHALDGG